MNSSEGVLPQPQLAHQKPASPFKFLKPLALLAAVIVIALVAGTGGYWLGSRTSKRDIWETGTIQCRGGSSGFKITIQVPDQWVCQPDNYGLALHSKLFKIEITYLARLPVCPNPQDCVTSEFYTDDNLSLQLLNRDGQDVEIFGDYKDGFWRTSVTYKDMETRKLTEHEKNELIKVLNSVKYEEKPFGY
jgi:hypothetical protein